MSAERSKDFNLYADCANAIASSIEQLRAALLVHHWDHSWKLDTDGVWFCCVCGSTDFHV